MSAAVYQSSPKLTVKTGFDLRACPLKFCFSFFRIFSMNSTNKQGALLAVCAFVLWGIAPLYFKLLEQVPSLEILVFRIVWSSLLLVAIIIATKHWQSMVNIIKSKRSVGILLGSSSLLAFNWWLFIWSVNNDHILDASLGYYINPLLNVALGMIFLGERLSRLQYFAVGLAIAGVAVQLITFGSFPVIAFSLAGSFAIYGLIRKTVSIDSVSGLTFESLIMLIPAVVYWWMFATSPESNMLQSDLSTNLLVISAGIVTTAPLLCFVAASKRLAYSTLGFFQYIGPSIMFLLGVFYYQEEMGQDRWVTFGFIWTALVIFSYASYRKMKNKKASN